MTGRPESLYPLFSELEALPGVGPKTEKLFQGLNVQFPRDLIYLLPTSGIDRQMRESVLDVAPPTTVTVNIRVHQHRPARGKGRPYRIDVSDSKTSFQLVFFHAREDWLKKQLPEDSSRIVSGKLEVFDNILQMVHPDHILSVDQASELPKFESVYPLTSGITQKLMNKAVSGAIKLAPELLEWIDPGVLENEKWPAWKDAIFNTHMPQDHTDIAAVAPSRRRLAYDEFFAHQLTLALARRQRRRASGQASIATGRLLNAVLKALPYRPTNAQSRVVSEIQRDMGRPERMSRLLQGDVGSGKTLVALLAMLTAVEAGGQGVMMAPTEVLARQHFNALRSLAEPAGIRIEILTGRDKGSERRKKLDDLANGKIDILLGTHAVFQKDVVFQDLRIAIVDEQHRFGVAQRMELGRKGRMADLLVMTATPIPRSLSLAQYGDLDVSILDEKPPGRTPISTAMISEGRLEEVVEHLSQALKEGRQAYWVCPLVGESEVSDLAAAEERFRHLRAVLGDQIVGLVHGQLPPAEKDEAMQKFVEGETRILVSTTVIEVGVDVPNASIMVIERAESFGLAQLHQLRGRVGRGSAQSTCLLLYRTPLTENGRRRLELLRETEDGFRIAEEDLAMRGAGDVLGTAQSGLPIFRVADLESQTALMAMARKDAQRLIESDPSLNSARGLAARHLLWLLDQDQALQMISIG